MSTENVTDAPALTVTAAGWLIITGAVAAGRPPPPPPLEGGAAIVKTKLADALGPLALVAVTEAVKLPAVVGVPLITPVPELIDNPAGKPIAA